MNLGFSNNGFSNKTYQRIGTNSSVEEKKTTSSNQNKTPSPVPTTNASVPPPPCSSFLSPIHASLQPRFIGTTAETHTTDTPLSASEESTPSANFSDHSYENETLTPKRTAEVNFSDHIYENEILTPKRTTEVNFSNPTYAKLPPEIIGATAAPLGAIAKPHTIDTPLSASEESTPSANFSDHIYENKILTPKRTTEVNFSNPTYAKLPHEIIGATDTPLGATVGATASDPKSTTSSKDILSKLSLLAIDSYNSKTILQQVSDSTTINSSQMLLLCIESSSSNPNEYQFTSIYQTKHHLVSKIKVDSEPIDKSRFPHSRSFDLKVILQEEKARLLKSESNKKKNNVADIKNKEIIVLLPLNSASENSFTPISQRDLECIHFNFNTPPHNNSENKPEYDFTYNAFDKSLQMHLPKNITVPVKVKVSPHTKHQIVTITTPTTLTTVACDAGDISLHSLKTSLQKKIVPYLKQDTAEDPHTYLSLNNL